ncbi:uncharacterized protein LOC125742383 [Brienomyrus brachyistius]|uniref:uncharacterized protein LOC125742383 n=1 Tax=Brienomyrus brachyistius TaxID=42636 RepID=UPI0020B1A333|nr:uncharacterized protein LOC125742383 [Brienomyrus brachyistius]
MSHIYHFLPVYAAILGLVSIKTSLSVECNTTNANETWCLGATPSSYENNLDGMCNVSVSQQACFMKLPDSTINTFSQCIGLSFNTPFSSKDHIWNLHGIIDTALDIYSFMRSSFSHGSILELFDAMNLNPETDRFNDTDFVKAWFEVKLRPLLSTLSQEFLSCLSTKHFSCETYQTVVEELNKHFSGMDSVRKKWIYMSFMYPFLSRNSTEGTGCASPEDSSEDWLLKNFGLFSAMARFKHLTELNVFFRGLEVLHILTPEQKAELLLHPELSGLDNNKFRLVFKSMLNPLLENQDLTDSTTPQTTTLATTVSATTAERRLQKRIKGFLTFFKPVGSFVKKFVSLTKQEDFSSMKSITLTQAIMNWTLSELASHFVTNITDGDNTTPTPPPIHFDITDINDWFLHVAVPLLKRFLPHNQTVISGKLGEIFHHVFSLNNSADHELPGPADVCSISSVGVSCSVPNAIENMAYFFYCASHANLSLTEENIVALLIELSKALNSLLENYCSLNFMSVGSYIRDIIGLPQTHFTEENLQDVNFIQLWFQIKLRPHLSSLSKEFLSCLSTKNFSCETFQALVLDLSNHISEMGEIQQQFIYNYFIYPFLSRKDISDPSCTFQASSSKDWLIKNFGAFSIFAHLEDFYKLYKNFSALEVLDVLTPYQKAELIVFPYNELENPSVVINTVFQYFLESPKETNFEKCLQYLVSLAQKVNISCDSYRTIFMNLDVALSAVSTDVESFIIEIKEHLIHSVPQDCPVATEKCLVTTVNGSKICSAINSKAICNKLVNHNIENTLCKYSIEEYACMPLTGISQHDFVELLQCKLQNNCTSSKQIWMLFFQKISGQLDEILDLYYNPNISFSSLSISNVLDVIGEITIDKFNSTSLRNVDVINQWFQRKLHSFLPSVSKEFLSCLSTKNFSCETFQAVVKALSDQVSCMNTLQRQSVYTLFIYPFLSRNDTLDGSCISDTNSSLDWLQKNFGAFSVFAPLEDLVSLNSNFSGFDSLPLLSPTQIAEVVLRAREININQTEAVFNRLEIGNSFQNVDEFLTKLAQSPAVSTSSCKCKIH